MVLRNYSNRFLYSSILVWMVVNAVVVVSYNHDHNNNNNNNNMSGGNWKQRQKHVPPVFTWNDLKYGRRDEELKKVLTTTGLLSIEMNDQHNEEALQWLCDCSSELHQLEGGEERPLKDGKTIRSTLASATMGLSHPQPLPHQQLSQLQHCSSTSTKVLETLRDDVSAYSQQFIVALDRLLLQQQQQPSSSSSSSFTTKTAALMENSYGRTYHSVKDIVSKSHNLEHFHVYTHNDHNNDVKTKDDGYHQAVDSALSSHMDAGLFLAFVPAMNCHHSSSSDDDDSDDDSFHIHHHHHHHSSQPVSFEPGTMAIMLGAGAEYWLSSPLPLKATRHSVQMKPNTKRSWYGMMHLVPSNAIIEKYPEPKTFADMRSSMALTSTNKKQADNNNNNNGGAVTMGCGTGSPTTTSTSSGTREYSPSDSPQRRRVEMVDDASVCNNSTNFYCWMVCQDIPDSNQAQHHIDQDQSLYCLDPAVLHDTQSLSQAVQSCSDPQTGTSGGAMDDACIGSWQKTSDKTIPSQSIAGTTIHPNNNNNNNHNKHNNNNVTPKKMDRPYCFGGTSMLMGGFEWESNTCIVYLFPKWVLSTRTKMIVACIGTSLAGMALEGIIAGRRYVTTQIMVNTNNGTQILLTSAFFYMMQLSLGYLLMLVVMTYSGPLFMSVIIGIISGHVGFNFMGRNSPRKINTFIPEGSTPCCQNDLGGVGPRRLSSSNNHKNTCSPTCDMNHATTNTTPPTTVCGSDTRPSLTDVEHNFTIDPTTTTTNPLGHDSEDEEFFANLPPCCQPKQRRQQQQP